jgi:hypothetical protein
MNGEIDVDELRTNNVSTIDQSTRSIYFDGIGRGRRVVAIVADRREQFLLLVGRHHFSKVEF